MVIPKEAPVTHLLVDQLRFARAEFMRGFEGVSAEDATRRLGPMNCMSWIIAHLAYHEQAYWLRIMNNPPAAPEVDEWAGYGRPASQPPLADALDAWRRVTAACDPFLDSLTSERLLEVPLRKGKPFSHNVGSMIQRVIYHYFYHTGEAQAIRQMLDHPGRPEYIGDIHLLAPYRAERS